MRKLVLSILMLGILLAIVGSVSAINCVEDEYCSTACHVVIDEPQEGDYYDPVTISWHYEGTCRPVEYSLYYQEGSCEGDNWQNIEHDLGAITTTYEWDVTDFESGEYCIAVNMDQLSGPDAGSTTGVFILDLDDPELEIIVGDPKVIDGEDTYVNQETPITLECTDDGEYDSGVDYIEYSINGGEWMTYDEPFTFCEDSHHTLEARCVDMVGKYDEKEKDFIVDSVGPVVSRIVGMPNIPTEGGYYVTEDTEICVSAMNDEEEPHPVPGEITLGCKGVELDDDNCFHYTEDSEHQLYCWAEDALGNTGEEDWTDFVESQAPITTASFEGPYYTDGYAEWIDGVSTVALNAVDPEPHPVGVETTYYRYEIVDDEYCRGEQYEDVISLSSVDEYEEEWMTYEGPFSIPEQSCHMIEYYSIDFLGNQEEVGHTFVFVDKTAPTTHKVVGRPNHQCGTNDNECEEGWDYIVTTNTDIELSCTDNEPHPSGIKELCYQVTLDGDAQGWNCVPSDEVIVQFPEESEHLLEFYCVDNVDKTSEIDSELFKVEGEQVTIDLYKKWNLISIPFNLISSDIEEVFSQISDDVEVVWSYDEDGWHVYSPEGPSNLDVIEPGYGYWVKAKEDTTLVVGGSLLGPAPGVPPSRELQKGWNLIGHYGTEEKSVYCSLFSLIDTSVGYPRWSALFGYDAPSDNFISLNAMNPGDKTKPGKGYWIEMDVDDLYSPATTCWGFSD